VHVTFRFGQARPPNALARAPSARGAQPRAGSRRPGRVLVKRSRVAVPRQGRVTKHRLGVGLGMSGGLPGARSPLGHEGASEPLGGAASDVGDLLGARCGQPVEPQSSLGSRT